MGLRSIKRGEFPSSLNDMRRINSRRGGSINESTWPSNPVAKIEIK